MLFCRFPRKINRKLKKGALNLWFVSWNGNITIIGILGLKHAILNPGTLFIIIACIIINCCVVFLMIVVNLRCEFPKEQSACTFRY